MIAMLGAGAMGAAVATHLLRGGECVVLLCERPGRGDLMGLHMGLAQRRSPPGLGVVLHPGVVIQEWRTPGLA